MACNALPKLFKRAPYRNYETIKDQISDILNALRKTKRGDIAEFSRQTGIPFSTLSRWQKELIRNASFNPLDKKYGLSLRIFTDLEEDAIADYITQNYILKGLYFTDDDFIEVAMAAYREKYIPILNSEDPNIRKTFKEFHCSRGFINDFKYHHGFSSKVFHLKRRRDMDNPYETKFLEDMKNLFETVDHELILNCDETGWKLFPSHVLTWAETGVDNVGRSSLINDKTQVTVLATVSAVGTKLPLLFIAQGKTSASEASQLGDVGYHWTAHSETGWMTDSVFKFYLMKLREHIGHDETIHLVIDLYPAHMTEEVNVLAANLKFILHIIPAGMTDKYQPLDRRIFGPLKAKARKFFRMRHKAGSIINGSKQEACQDMIAAWESIGVGMVQSAWSIYVEDEENSPEKIEHDKLLVHHRQFLKNHRKEVIQRRLATRMANNDRDDDTYKSLIL